MICKRGGFVIQRHNELRDLQAEMLRMVRSGVETEPVLQDITGEELNRGANTAPDARLDIVARGFWERQRLAFFDVRICHPNADSYRDMDLNQIYRQHETEKKRQYASRVLEVEQATFTPLVLVRQVEWRQNVSVTTVGLLNYLLQRRGKATRLPCSGSGLGCPLRC